MTTIPLETHLITLLVNEQRIVTRQIQVGRTTQTRRMRVTQQREIPPGETAATVRAGVTLANQVLEPINISFRLTSINNQRTAAPQNREVVTDNGFLYLAGQYPTRRGARLFVVHRFAGQEGGQAIEAQRVCIVKRLGSPLFGKTLAHELGHLLNLDHVTTGTAARYNLMWPGLRAGDRLEPAQIQRALRSGLARAFPARQSP
ncbi:MAG: hypothetical protein GY792_03340 [Gammaproteobacteria bacterium]|nr:hypothetical protein [Gammaproteobacteria bacterium]